MCIPVWTISLYIFILLHIIVYIVLDFFIFCIFVTCFNVLKYFIFVPINIVFNSYVIVSQYIYQLTDLAQAWLFLLYVHKFAIDNCCFLIYFLPILFPSLFTPLNWNLHFCLLILFGLTKNLFLIVFSLHIFHIFW